MKPAGEKLLAKARRALVAARRLASDGDAEFAIGRAYYSMFYAAQALLDASDLRFSSHGAVHGAFGQHFAKTGLLDEKYHRWMLDAFDRRIAGDYGVDAVIGDDEAVSAIERAAEFIEAVRAFLERSP